MATASITVHAEFKGIEETIQRMEDAEAKINAGCIQAVSESADFWRDVAQETINKRRPYTYATIESSAAGMDGYVGSDDIVAAVLETGSRPHDIPHGFGRDGDIPHPGTQPYLWIERSGEEALPYIQVIFEEKIDAAVATI